LANNPLFNRLLPSGKESFSVHRVRLFFHHRHQWPEFPWTEQLLLFIVSLNEKGSYQNWQIRQADQAVSLYFSNFLGAKDQGHERENAIVNLDDDDSFSLSEALIALTKVLRLKNYSSSTEKSYNKWCIRFFDYVKAHSPELKGEAIKVNQKYVRDFLAHLAVQRYVSAATQNQAFDVLLIFSVMSSVGT